MSNKSLFRINFLVQDEVYEIYARSVSESEMFGFIEVEDIVFGENTSVVVDPSEERLKAEFADIKCTYIPMHSVIRVDEVDKEGTPKIRQAHTDSGKISPFPGVYNNSPKGGDKAK